MRLTFTILMTIIGAILTVLYGNVYPCFIFLGGFAVGYVYCVTCDGENHEDNGEDDDGIDAPFNPIGSISPDSKERNQDKYTIQNH